MGIKSMPLGFGIWDLGFDRAVPGCTEEAWAWCYFLLELRDDPISIDHILPSLIF